MTQTLPADLLAACANGNPSPAQVLSLRGPIAALGAGASPRLLRHAAFDALSLPPLPAHNPGQAAADGGRAWLALNAANGRRREAAVRVLDPPISGFEMAMLLARLNDWVREVRIAAEQCLVVLAPAIPPAVVADRAVQVRKVLAEGLSRLDPAMALPLAQRLAADRNAPVRLRAVFFLEKGAR